MEVEDLAARVHSALGIANASCLSSHLILLILIFIPDHPSSFNPTTYYHFMHALKDLDHSH
jgi:hypothetical protein